MVILLDEGDNNYINSVTSTEDPKVKQLATHWTNGFYRFDLVCNDPGKAKAFFDAVFKASEEYKNTGKNEDISNCGCIFTNLQEVNTKNPLVMFRENILKMRDAIHNEQMFSDIELFDMTSH